MIKVKVKIIILIIIIENIINFVYDNKSKTLFMDYQKIASLLTKPVCTHVV